AVPAPGAASGVAFVVRAADRRGHGGAALRGAQEHELTGSLIRSARRSVRLPAPRRRHPRNVFIGDEAAAAAQFHGAVVAVQVQGAHHVGAGAAGRDQGRDAGFAEQRHEVFTAQGQVQQDHGQLGQRLQRGGAVVGQRIEFADDDHGRQLGQGLEADVRFGHQQVVGDGDIDLRGAQLVDQAFLVVLDLRHRGLGVGARESLAQLGGDHGRQRGEAAHAHGAAHLALRAAGHVIQGHGLVEQAADFPQDFGACGRDGQALRMVAHEQRHLQLRLHLGDGRGDGRGRDVDAVGGLGNAAELARCHAVFQLSEGQSCQHGVQEVERGRAARVIRRVVDQAADRAARGPSRKAPALCGVAGVVIAKPLRHRTVALGWRLRGLHAVRQPGGLADKVQRRIPVEVPVHGRRLGVGRALRKQLEAEPVAGVVRVEQVARIGQQPAAVVGLRLRAERIELAQPGAGVLVLEAGVVRRQADLAAAQLAHGVHHVVQLAGGQRPTREQQRLVGHHQPGRAALGQRDGGREVGVDAFAVAGQAGQPVLHGLQLLHAGLARVVQGRAYQHVGQLQAALQEGEGRVAVQRLAQEMGGPGVAVEQHVLPGNQHVVEDHDGIHFVEAMAQRMVLGRCAGGQARAADEAQAGRAQVADEAYGVFGLRRVAPVRQPRLGEGLVGIGGSGLVLGAAHDDACIGLLDHVQQHVGVLVLRQARAVALGVGVGRYVEQVATHHAADVGADVGGKARVQLVEHVLAVEQRPHLAHALVAH
ncbi:unnamed protein product, partial [Ilex paraguariensis]